MWPYKFIVIHVDLEQKLELYSIQLYIQRSNGNFNKYKKINFENSVFYNSGWLSKLRKCGVNSSMEIIIGYNTWSWLCNPHIFYPVVPSSGKHSRFSDWCGESSPLRRRVLRLRFGRWCLKGLCIWVFLLWLSRRGFHGPQLQLGHPCRRKVSSSNWIRMGIPGNIGTSPYSRSCTFCLVARNWCRNIRWWDWYGEFTLWSKQVCRLLFGTQHQLELGKFSFPL